MARIQYVIIEKDAVMRVTKAGGQRARIYESDIAFSAAEVETYYRKLDADKNAAIYGGKVVPYDTLPSVYHAITMDSQMRGVFTVTEKKYVGEITEPKVGRYFKDKKQACDYVIRIAEHQKMQIDGKITTLVKQKLSCE